MKNIIIVLVVIFVIWLLIGGIFSDNDYFGSYAPEGIEDYNSPPSNPYGN